jgi:hypothetical protein
VLDVRVADRRELRKALRDLPHPYCNLQDIGIACHRREQRAKHCTTYRTLTTTFRILAPLATAVSFAQPLALHNAVRVSHVLVIVCVLV